MSVFYQFPICFHPRQFFIFFSILLFSFFPYCHSHQLLTSKMLIFVWTQELHMKELLWNGRCFCECNQSWKLFSEFMESKLARDSFTCHHNTSIINHAKSLFFFFFFFLSGPRIFDKLSGKQGAIVCKTWGFSLFWSQPFSSNIRYLNCT